MKSMAQKFVALFLAVAAGCFPESEGQLPNLSLRIPLDQLAGTPSQEALDSWLGWRRQPQRSVFQLYFDRQNFFLGLRLKCSEGSVSFNGSDQMLKIETDNNGKQFLVLNLYADNGTVCRFSTVVYLTALPDVIELFSGTSDEIPSLVERQKPVEINAGIHPRSAAVCSQLSVGDNAFCRFAAMDIDEDVRLPPLEVKPSDGQVSFTLAGLPIGRKYVLHKACVATGAEIWEATDTNFVLTTVNGREEICAP